MKDDVLFFSTTIRDSPMLATMRRVAMESIQNNFLELKPHDISICVPYLAIVYVDQYIGKRVTVDAGSAVPLVSSHFFLKALGTMGYTDLMNDLKPKIFEDQVSSILAPRLANEVPVDLRPVTPMAFVDNYLGLLREIVFTNKKLVYTLLLHLKADVNNCLERPSTLAAAAILTYIKMYMPQKAFDKSLGFFSAKLRLINPLHNPLLRVVQRLEPFVTTYAAPQAVNGADVLMSVEDFRATAHPKKSKVWNAFNKTLRKAKKKGKEILHGKGVHHGGSGSKPSDEDEEDEEASTSILKWKEIFESHVLALPGGAGDPNA